MALRIPPMLRRAIERHAADTYPDECCGALLGRLEGEDRWLTRIEALPNARTADHHAYNRFLVTDRDYMKVERLAAQEDLTLLGFYHSHPDHPARPSATDLEHAFPWFSYVILAVADGVPGEMTSWQLTEDETELLPEAISPPASTPEEKGP